MRDGGKCRGGKAGSQICGGFVGHARALDDGGAFFTRNDGGGLLVEVDVQMERMVCQWFFFASEAWRVCVVVWSNLLTYSGGRRTSTDSACIQSSIA